jgi:hypothetical protein
MLLFFNNKKPVLFTTLITIPIEQFFERSRRVFLEFDLLNACFQYINLFTLKLATSDFSDYFHFVLVLPALL